MVEDICFDIAVQVAKYSKTLAKEYGAETACDICGKMVGLIMDYGKEMCEKTVSPIN